MFCLFFWPNWEQLDAIPIYISMVLGMYGCLELGRWWGRRQLASNQSGGNEWIGIIDGPILAVYGLLLAFTFSNAMSRHEERKKNIIEEANIVAQAYWQVDLMPSAAQPQFREQIKDYIRSRLNCYRLRSDATAYQHELDRSHQIQDQLWHSAVRATGSETARSDASSILSSLNELGSLTTSRKILAAFHPPAIIMLFLLALSLVASFLVGYQVSTLKKKSWPHIVLFLAFLAFINYLIIDLEYPHVGWIQINDVEIMIQQIIENIPELKDVK
jgi:hypothetical protein